ncbi:hypothetical protein OTT_1900 [Orientia tsutsugamushi str. Ikeda]|uniref:Transposase n=2 Tax=Orientia tsutsugamushi TaxID=784 RepID=B3CVG1_ORITI|nr:hypothetical protein OTT_1900 [Orientia tsutsugamushi str. Ikeda]
MLEYMLKHIHQRDMLKLWEEFLIKFKHGLILDKEKGNSMRTIAAKYIDEGIAKGRAEAAQELTRNLLKAGFLVEFISETTGLSKEEVVNVKNNMDY